MIEAAIGIFCPLLGLLVVAVSRLLLLISLAFSGVGWLLREAGFRAADLADKMINVGP
jgi:hypothetical protein